MNEIVPVTTTEAMTQLNIAAWKLINQAVKVATDLFAALETALKKVMDTAISIVDEIAEWYRTVPNNWLKMHGYPMRRKRRHK